MSNTVMTVQNMAKSLLTSCLNESTEKDLNHVVCAYIADSILFIHKLVWN